MQKKKENKKEKEDNKTDTTAGDTFWKYLSQINTLYF